jgi:hypothetical protein
VLAIQQQRAYSGKYEEQTKSQPQTVAQANMAGIVGKSQTKEGKNCLKLFDARKPGDR